MMLLRKASLAALLLASVSGYAAAADLPEPIIEPPPPIDYVPPPAPAFGGWYIRGDVDYHWNDFRGADYYTYKEECDPCGIKTLKGERNGHLDGDLDGGWSVGGGVGYQITDYLRADLTADYFSKSDFEGHTEGWCGTGAAGHACTSDDSTELSTWLLLANAYADLFTYQGVTAYAGAGIGGAHVKWDTLTNKVEHDTNEHEGSSDWRFAYALMAGVSYCLTNNLDVDVGYQYAHVTGGEMFGYEKGGGPGFDDGLNIHSVKAGLRYNFGGKAYREGCGAPPSPEPEPLPPVYK